MTNVVTAANYNVMTVKSNQIKSNLLTRSPAVARMADHTAPVIKLTLTLVLISLGPRECHGISAHATAAERAIIWQKQALLT